MASPFKDWTPEMAAAHNARVRGIVSPAPVAEKATTGKPASQKQTKTEMEYGRMLAMEFPGASIIPWGITLRLTNGHKFTPDFVVKNDSGVLLVVECKQRGKNGFRQHSYQRARVMFDQSRVEYPFWRWRWSEKQSGTWTENNY